MIYTVNLNWRISDTTQTDGDPNCWRCRGTGWLVDHDAPVGSPTFGKAFPCNCLLDRKRETAVRALGGDFQHMTFDSFKGHITERSKVQSFIQEDNAQRSLVLYGDPGIGKTHLAVASTRALRESGQRADFIPAAKLFASLRSAISRNEDQETLFDSYANTPYLVIDDMGVEKVTEWVGERMDYLISERYSQALKTVITTNNPPSEFPTRIASRIHDAKYGVVVHMMGESFRSKRRDA